MPKVVGGEKSWMRWVTFPFRLLSEFSGQSLLLTAKGLGLHGI